MGKTESVINDKIKIQLIIFGTAKYDDELILREETLKKPLGISIYDEDLSSENLDYHIGAYYEEALVGIIILTKINDEEIKMRQLGVTESLRGKGIAESLILYSEELIKNLGFSKIVLNAREKVVRLYEKLGYHVIGDSFLEVTIPHFKMQKQL